LDFLQLFKDGLANDDCQSEQDDENDYDSGEAVPGRTSGAAANFLK